MYTVDLERYKQDKEDSSVIDMSRQGSYNSQGKFFKDTRNRNLALAK